MLTIRNDSAHNRSTFRWMIAEIAYCPLLDIGKVWYFIFVFWCVRLHLPVSGITFLYLQSRTEINVHLTFLECLAQTPMLKMFICFNLIKAYRCLIIPIIAPHDPLQSEGQYYALWYQTLCGSLVQLEGLISVHSTILTQQPNSEYPRSPWISLHKLSGLNFSYFHSSFSDIFTLHKYT